MREGVTGDTLGYAEVGQFPSGSPGRPEYVPASSVLAQ